MRAMSVHPLPVRVTHWINACGMPCMFLSGWGIYNASPLLAFKFPLWATLGGWLGGSIAWHLAVMWLLVVNGLAYGVYGLCSGHFAKAFGRVSAKAVKTDLAQALHFKLPHQAGRYNAVQRLLYWLVLLLGVAVVLSGLAIWKPIQLYWLADLLGGFDVARYVHFAAMAGIGLFVVIHLALVLLVPRTLWPMIAGGKP
ncbi:MAG: cytochrome b/b6 domain-containing protein [Pseudomonas sp.]|nr:cytochrome b/b6 domain-containing protein [Pseudomonas sp.]